MANKVSGVAQVLLDPLLVNRFLLSAQIEWQRGSCNRRFKLRDLGLNIKSPIRKIWNTFEKPLKRMSNDP